MSVYVDDMGAPFGRMVMFHMIADTTEELLAMARRVGIREKWIQFPGSYKEHFDICKAKRAAAVKAGAVEITWRQYGEMVRGRKTNATMHV